MPDGKPHDGEFRFSGGQWQTYSAQAAQWLNMSELGPDGVAIAEALAPYINVVNDEFGTPLTFGRADGTEVPAVQLFALVGDDTAPTDRVPGEAPTGAGGGGPGARPPPGRASNEPSAEPPSWWPPSAAWWPKTLGQFGEELIFDTSAFVRMANEFRPKEQGEARIIQGEIVGAPPGTFFIQDVNGNLKVYEPSGGTLDQGEVVRGEDVGGPPGSWFIRQANGNLTPYTPPVTQGDTSLSNVWVVEDQAGVRHTVAVGDNATVKRFTDAGGRFLGQPPIGQQIATWGKEQAPRGSYQDYDVALVEAGKIGGDLKPKWNAELIAPDGRRGAFELVGPDQQPDARSTEELLTRYLDEAIDTGDWGAVTELSDFLDRPSEWERLRAAIDISNSPADYLTVMAMARGQLPIQAQAGAFERIGPQSQIFDLFGFGAGAEGARPDEGLTPAPAGAPGAPGTPGAEVGFTAGPEADLEAEMTGGAKPGETELAPGVFYSPETGIRTGATPEEREVVKTEKQGFTPAEQIGQIGPTTKVVGVQGTVTGAPGGAPGGGPGFGPGDVTVEWLEAEFIRARERFRAGEITQQEYDAITNGLFAIQQRTGVGLVPEGERQFVPTGNGATATTGGFTRGGAPEEGNLLPVKPPGSLLDEPGFSAVKAVGIEGKAIGQVDVRAPAMGALKFPSMQAWRRFSTLEQEAFKQSVVSQGQDWNEYARQWEKSIGGTAEGFGGPSRRIPIAPKKARVGF